MSAADLGALESDKTACRNVVCYYSRKEGPMYAALYCSAVEAASAFEHFCQVPLPCQGELHKGETKRITTICVIMPLMADILRNIRHGDKECNHCSTCNNSICFTDILTES